MGLFGNQEEKDAKKEEKAQKLMAKYGLDNLSPEYREMVKNINYELMGSGALEMATKLNFSTKPEDNLKISYLNTLVQQNWMIIKLLDDLKNK